MPHALNLQGEMGLLDQAAKPIPRWDDAPGSHACAG